MNISLYCFQNVILCLNVINHREINNKYYIIITSFCQSTVRWRSLLDVSSLPCFLQFFSILQTWQFLQQHCSLFLDLFLFLRIQYRTLRVSLSSFLLARWLAQFHFNFITVERRLSGLRLSGLSNYPDQSDVLLCFFSGIFQNFPAKTYLFPQILWRR